MSLKKEHFSSDTNDEINVEPKHYQCKEGHGSLSNEQYIINNNSLGSHCDSFYLEHC